MIHYERSLGVHEHHRITNIEIIPLDKSVILYMSYCIQIWRILYRMQAYLATKIVRRFAKAVSGLRQHLGFQDLEPCFLFESQ